MFKIKKITIFLMTIFMIVSLCSFSKADNNSGRTTYPLKIVDAYKRVITIDKEPQRIVSVSPNLTETIFALGKGSKLVGRSDYCDYPAEVSKVPSVGELINPNIEKIIALKPDVVVSSNLLSQEVTKKLEDLNIKVLSIYGGESFDGVYDNITKLGLLVNAGDKAKNIIIDMKYRVASIVAKMKKITKKPTVYYLVSYGKMGDYAATKDTFIGAMVEMAGGINVANDSTQWKYSLEKLIQKNPDLIISPKSYGYKAGIESTNGYKDLKAVKNGKLLEIDNNLLDKQGPRIAQGLEALAKLIHPELFKK